MFREAPIIRKLDEKTVNRIAAGEIVQRPAAVVKEMIENSLDAGSTTISILCKQGGFAQLQIHDNGHGIRKDDLGIVCERFTTSKISDFEDLKEISTFGFRGEALASITHVAHVTVTTRTADSDCAFKAKYCEGKVVPLKPGVNTEPRPCAGNIGTKIVVEDLFHNMKTRKQVFKSHSEEYNKVLDVCSRYSIQYAKRGVSFNCKRVGNTNADLQTPIHGSTKDAIRSVYGNAVANHLLSFQFDSHHCSVGDVDFNVDGYISSPNYSAKKERIILFVNNRLVEIPLIKKTISAVYNEMIPKHSYPFVYMSISMPPENIDVNVHPTKKEVHFIDEIEISRCIEKNLREHLSSANGSRTFSTQLLSSNCDQSLLIKDDQKSISDMFVQNPVSLSISLSPSSSTCRREKNYLSVSKPPKKGYTSQHERADLKYCHSTDGPALNSSRKRQLSSQSVADCKKFRSHCALTSINAVFGTQTIVTPNTSHVYAVKNNDFFSCASFIRRQGAKNCICCTGEVTCTIKPTLPPCRYSCSPHKSVPDFKIDSIQLLKKEIEKNENHDAMEIIKQSSFVGLVDDKFSLAQYQTKLLIINHESLSTCLFYQLALKQVGRMGSIFLKHPINIQETLMVILNVRESFRMDNKSDKVDISLTYTELLKEKSSVLEKYFKISIDKNGFLCSIPNLLNGYNPIISHIPSFLFHLATEVTWENENSSFIGIIDALATFYSRLPDFKSDSKNKELILSNILFPAFHSYLIPDAKLFDVGISHCDCKLYGNIVQITTLEKLFNVFERC